MSNNAVFIDDTGIVYTVTLRVDGLSLNALTKLLHVIWEEQDAELGFLYRNTDGVRLQTRS